MGNGKLFIIGVVITAGKMKYLSKCCINVYLYE